MLNMTLYQCFHNFSIFNSAQLSRVGDQYLDLIERHVFVNSNKYPNFMELIARLKLRQIGTVGRATVPAGIGRHGLRRVQSCRGRPYAKMAQFLI